MSAPPDGWWHALPAVNATLNGASAGLLLVGYIAIKRRKVTTHASLMISAVVTSTAFLACYLTFHAMKVRHGEVVTRFPQSAWRPLYLVILGTHTLLAVVILPLTAMTLWFAWRRRWMAHRRVSVLTFPLWMYVSVTGVVVYWMLYHLAPGFQR